MKAAVVKETPPGECRVALVPDAIAKLRPAGIDVLVESGAGDGAWLPDAVYAEAGASIVSAAEIYRTADVILTVTRPSAAAVSELRPGQAVIGMLAPLTDPEFAAALAARGVTAISLDGLPRTLSRAQPMDALSSQSNVAGYKAVLVAAATYGRFFPLLITAAGTARPAKVLVLGAGVAGLQAIGTARRLGAVVSGYDVRPASKGEVESLGATFVELTSVESAAGEGGYARELTRRRAPGPAGRADRPHRQARRGDHDRAGTRPQAAAAGDRGRDQGDVPRVGHRGHGRQRARRQRDRIRPRRDARHRKRGHHRRSGQPARHRADRGLERLLAEHLRAAPAHDLRRRTGHRYQRRNPGRRGDRT